MKNNTSIKVPAKYVSMLSEIDYEGRQDGYWAYSVPGFMFADMGTHTAHEDTQADLLRVIRSLVPCDCKECREALAESQQAEQAPQADQPNQTEGNEEEMEENVKLNVLAAFLGENAEDWTATSYDPNRFECGNREYLVLTDGEADDATAAYIKETAWAFRAQFVVDHTGKNFSAAAVKALEKMQGELCEDANELVLALIEDFDSFVDDAVSSDGRGHFLSQYDGEENEEEGADGETYYIYRCN
jgi:hypothetical protein